MNRFRVTSFNKNSHNGLNRQRDLPSIFACTVHLTLMEISMSKLVLRFLKDNSGVTAIEYGLIAAGIAVVIIVAVQATGTSLNKTFNSVSGALNP